MMPIMTQSKRQKIAEDLINPWITRVYGDMYNSRAKRYVDRDVSALWGPTNLKLQKALCQWFIVAIQTGMGRRT